MARLVSIPLKKHEHCSLMTQLSAALVETRDACGSASSLNFFFFGGGKQAFACRIPGACWHWGMDELSKTGGRGWGGTCFVETLSLMLEEAIVAVT